MDSLGALAGGVGMLPPKCNLILPSKQQASLHSLQPTLLQLRRGQGAQLLQHAVRRGQHLGSCSRWRGARARWRHLCGGLHVLAPLLPLLPLLFVLLLSGCWCWGRLLLCNRRGRNASRCCSCGSSRRLDWPQASRHRSSSRLDWHRASRSSSSRRRRSSRRLDWHRASRRRRSSRRLDWHLASCRRSRRRRRCAGSSALAPPLLRRPCRCLSRSWPRLPQLGSTQQRLQAAGIA